MVTYTKILKGFEATFFTPPADRAGRESTTLTVTNRDVRRNFDLNVWLYMYNVLYFWILRENSYEELEADGRISDFLKMKCALVMRIKLTFFGRGGEVDERELNTEKCSSF